MDPLNEAHSHRQEAATYYAMRMECLRKAQEAYRSGNKPVASYYSHLVSHLPTTDPQNTLQLHFLNIINRIHNQHNQSSSLRVSNVHMTGTRRVVL